MSSPSLRTRAFICFCLICLQHVPVTLSVKAFDHFDLALFVCSVFLSLLSFSALFLFVGAVLGVCAVLFVLFSVLLKHVH